MSDTAESDRLQRKFGNLEGQLKLIENALRDLRAEISNTAGAAWDAVAAAGVAPQPEPEYEYAIQFGSDDEPWSDPSDDPHWLVESMLMSAGDYVARRVKAGAWEPAPNQEGEQP